MSALKKIYVYFVNHVGINRFIIFMTGYTVTGMLDGNLFMGLLAGYLAHRIFNPVKLTSSFFEYMGETYKYTYGDRMNITGEKLHGIQVELPVSLPHIFIDMRENDGAWGLQRSFRDIKKFDLEGDFGTKTTVYGNQADRLQILSVLQPNVMKAILDIAKDYDIEIIENQLMLYSRKKIYYKPKEVTKIINAAHAVIGAMHQYVRRGVHVKRENTGLMHQSPADRLVKFKHYSIGSMRKIITLLAVLTITLIFMPMIQNAFVDPQLNGRTNNAMAILATVMWVCMVLPVLYIGFSRKRIDITLS